ncbi:MAG TPA: hypothetical protein VGO18_16505 [Steroidobacteraceae bacterium]|nr:hypothetical protein [Steroidobacteraceae bacterium]
MPEGEGKWLTPFEILGLTAGTSFDRRKVTMIEPVPASSAETDRRLAPTRSWGSKARFNAGDRWGVTPPVPNGTSSDP